MAWHWHGKGRKGTLLGERGAAVSLCGVLFVLFISFPSHEAIVQVCRIVKFFFHLEFAAQTQAASRDKIGERERSSHPSISLWLVENWNGHGSWEGECLFLLF
jgi:hypothetical protein